MKIAYLILCHMDPEHIARLVRKITENTQNVAYVHVDAKVDVTPFQNLLRGLKQVRLLEKRTKIYWGGYSAIEATVDLMRCALKDGSYDRYVLLQGLEYPILSNARINEFFERNQNTEFILAQNISKKSDVREEHKYRLFYDLDRAQKITRKVIHKFNTTLMQHGIVPHLKRNYVMDASGRKMDIFQGCAQFGITSDAAAYIVNFHDTNKGFNRYFRTVYAVDEAYFHTIIYNSDFVRNTPDGRAVERAHLTDFENLTYFEYPVQVTLFTKAEDWPKLKDSGFLYFRKASSESKQLLDLIDQEHETEE